MCLLPRCGKQYIYIYIFFVFYSGTSQLQQTWITAVFALVLFCDFRWQQHSGGVSLGGPLGLRGCWLLSTSHPLRDSSFFFFFQSSDLLGISWHFRGFTAALAVKVTSSGCDDMCLLESVVGPWEYRCSLEFWIDTGTPELTLHKSLNIQFRLVAERQKNLNNPQHADICDFNFYMTFLLP